MKAFTVPVESVREAGDILEVLATYDVFLLEHNVRPDYSSAQGLQVFDPDDEDGWVEWNSSEGLDICEHMRNGDDLDGLVWEGTPTP